MAACLITVSGTMGVIRINYTISGTPYTIETSVGTFYIEDTATDVTYTTLSGDLIASSLCLTITEAAPSCYKIFWKNINAQNYTIDAVLLGMETLSISSVSFTNSGRNLIDAINNLNDDRVKVIGYKSELSNITTSTVYNCYYILKVLGAEVPILRVKNADNSGYMYFHGELQGDCLPQTGFTIIDPCYNTPPPAL